MRKTLVLTITTALTAIAGCAPTAYKITPIPVGEKLVETTVATDGGLFLPKIALIDIDGPILNLRKPGIMSSGENPTAMAVGKITRALNDKSVRAVVLRINSPGGSVTASQIIYRHVVELRNAKPVVAMIMDVGASGGYYIACGANQIIAEPTCITGSIGVIMMTFNLETLLDKVGVSTDAITSGPKKDAGSPFRPLKSEERKIFQAMIDEFYEQFVKTVADARDELTEDQVRKLADGRVYTGKQAHKLGLIDRTGSLSDAIDCAKQLADVKAARVIMYDKSVGYRSTVYSTAPIGRIQNSGSHWLDMLPDAMMGQTHFMYLWRP